MGRQVHEHKIHLGTFHHAARTVYRLPDAHFAKLTIGVPSDVFIDQQDPSVLVLEPMDTAPRDGRPIEVRLSMGDGTRVVRWYEAVGAWDAPGRRAPPRWGGLDRRG
jgi:hypothetical protein